MPPSKPVIRDERSMRDVLTYDVGPYEIDEDLVLECRVTGGLPPPKVEWWRNGVLVDSTDEAEIGRNNIESGTMVNKLIQRKLQREDLGTKYACHASNTNLTGPFITEVKLVLNCKYRLYNPHSTMFRERGSHKLYPV